MIRSIRFIRADVAAAAGLALFIAFQPLTAQAGCKFSVVTSPNPVPDGNDLFAVSATSATDAWAVGFYNPAPGQVYALPEHFDAVGWAFVSGQNPSPTFNYFAGVSGVSPTDVWAVGQYLPASGVYQPLIEHWNGSTWSVVPSPDTGNIAILRAVKAISAKNVWAVGTAFYGSGQSNTLVEHFDGLAWAIVSSPNVNNINNDLGSITANSPTDIWAGGIYSTGSANQTLVEHWNGANWAIVPTPNVNMKSNNFTAMAAISPTKVYAAGEFENNRSLFQTLIEGWDGTSFNILPSPNKGTGSTELFGMAGSRMTGVIAVGQYSQGNFSRTFALKLTSTGWKVVPSDNVGTFDNFLNGAVAIPGTDDAWAVGGTDNANFTKHQTLIELFNC